MTIYWFTSGGRWISGGARTAAFYPIELAQYCGYLINGDRFDFRQCGDRRTVAKPHTARGELVFCHGGDQWHDPRAPFGPASACPRDTAGLCATVFEIGSASCRA